MSKLKWIRPTHKELVTIIKSVSKKEVLELLGVSSSIREYWLNGKRNITESNWKMLKLYVDGVIDINGNKKEG